jgi:hypothetical protein
MYVTFPPMRRQTRTSGEDRRVRVAAKMSCPLGCPHQFPRMRSPATASARLGTGPRALSRTIPCKSTKAMASFGVIAISVYAVIKPLPLVARTFASVRGRRIGAKSDFSSAGDLGLAGLPRAVRGFFAFPDLPRKLQRIDVTWHVGDRNHAHYRAFTYSRRRQPGACRSGYTGHCPRSPGWPPRARRASGSWQSPPAWRTRLSRR